METAMVASAKSNPDYRYLMIDSASNTQALGYFGLSEKDVPAYVVHDAEPDYKYILPGAKPTGLDSFVKKFQVLADYAMQGLLCARISHSWH